LTVLYRIGNDLGLFLGNFVTHSLARYAIDIPNFLSVDGGCSTTSSSCFSNWFSWCSLIKFCYFPLKKKKKKDFF